MLRFHHSVHSGQGIVKHSGLVTSISNWLMRPTGSFALRTLSQRQGSLGSAQGRVRDGNQDRVLAASFDGLDAAESFEFFAVCDGLGGLQEGAQCASLAMSTIVASLVYSRRESNRQDRLLAAVELASRSVHERYRERGGTTVAAVLLTRSGATAIAVGDTRIYLHERAGNLSQLTVDDTIAERVAEFEGRQGAVPENSPFANHLAQFLGQSGPTTPQLIDVSTVFPESSPSPQSEGPKGLLLTSDGVHKLPKDVFSGVLKTTDVPREVVSRLIYVSEWAGGSDNESVLYLSAGVRSVRRRSEIIPTLFLQDAFNEWSLTFSIPEELADRGRYADVLAYRASLHDSHRGDLRSSPIQGNGVPAPVTGVRPGTRHTSQPVKAAIDPQRQGPLKSQAEVVSPSANGDRSPPGEASSRKRARGKGGKGTKRKKKEGRENAQPEFDILISHEPE